MDVVFYGTRGSIPVCDPKFHEFGGNTTCIALFPSPGESEFNRAVIVDAGTGIFKLGQDLVTTGLGRDSMTIAFTHFHWDHIQGFPFFKPAYDPTQDVSILALGADRGISDLKEIFATQMQETYFPVELENMGARFRFLLHDKAEQEYYSGKIRTIRLNHPGGSYGYRFEAFGQSVVVCTDVEYEDDMIPDEVVEFARGADLLIHDAQYTTKELERFRGWGHATFHQAIEVAKRAEVRLLAMTHHDPEHDDSFLIAMERKCQERMKDCFLAREGMRIRVDR